MTTTKFTDRFKDTLTIDNYNNGDGFLTIEQGGSIAGFAFKKDERLPIATSLLKTLEAVVIEGPLPDVRIEQHNGKKIATCGNRTGEVSEPERDYFLEQARKCLSIAGAIDHALVEEEVERQARLREQEARGARRDELAKKFIDLPWATYSSIPLSTKRAIDRIIELEDAAK